MSERHITEDEQRAAYDALGLDPDRFHLTVSVLLEPHQATVVRHAFNETGRRCLDEATGEPARVTTVLPLGVKETTDHA